MLRGKFIMMMMVLSVLTASVSGQYIGATIRLEKNSILIGDQIKAELEVTLPAGSKVNWPLLPDTLAAHIEILRKTGIDTVTSDKDKFTLKQDLTITSFDSGSYVINPILFKYLQPGDTMTYFTETTPVTLDVQTIPVDTSKDIKPIKPPLKAPVTFREVLPWIGLALLVLAIAAAVYFYLKRKKKVAPAPTTHLKTTIPPYEAAMEALEELRLKKLWQSGRVKEYYSELTDIVREYIELRYTVRAMEMTTSEIGTALRQVNVDEDTRDKLNKTLVLADLVKFAKEQPLPLENDLSMNQCVEFVRETKPAWDAEPATPSKAQTDVEQNNIK